MILPLDMGYDLIKRSAALANSITGFTYGLKRSISVAGTRAKTGSRSSNCARRILIKHYNHRSRPDDYSRKVVFERRR